MRRSAFSILRPAAVLLALTAPLPALAAEPEAAPGRLTVRGIGTASAEPDIARLSMAATGEARRPAEALSQASTGIAAVIDALAALGIAARDMQTTAVDLQPVFNRPEAGQSARITGYRAVNRLSITVRDLDIVGRAIAEGTEAGADELGQITFDIADRPALEAAARQAAMRDALDRAAQLAEAGGLTLGPVRLVEEGGGSAPIPMARGMVAAMEAAPVMGGTLEARATVSVTFDLGPDG
ncbi:MAG: SIMPL domain-containing protein [Pseudomonadota bacterium]